MARPVTFRSTSQIVVMRMSLRLAPAGDVFHPATLDATDGDSKCVIGAGRLDVRVAVRLRASGGDRGETGRHDSGILQELSASERSHG